MNCKDVKIAVCYHKPARLIKNRIFFPIHVGRDVAFINSKDGTLKPEEFSWLTKHMIGDNTGESISSQNRNYCELTAQYWMWKNSNMLCNPRYMGLMHYRRVIKFGDVYKNHYCVREKDILKELEKQEFDVVLTTPKKCFSMKTGLATKNVYEHFCSEHGNRLTHIMLDCVKKNYPNMIESLNRVMFGCQTISWYNIFIAKAEIFNEYTEWLFCILDKINEQCKREGYDLTESRMMGYYGEILLNIYFNYQKEIQGIKVRYLDDLRLPEDNRNEILDSSLKANVKRYVQTIDKKGDLKNKYLFCCFMSRKKRKVRERNISFVHSLTYRKYAPNGGAGGGGAVLSCQSILLQTAYRGMRLKYSFIEDNFYADKSNELWDLWAAADFAYKKAINEKNTVYITHDYGCAFGLYLSGKKYILVSHIQGARVEEKKNFGEIFTKCSETIIKYCEKKAMENAERLCFPSYGAYNYLTKSKYTNVNFKRIRLGPVLYNTIYAYPEEKIVEKIPLKKEFLTILSIGQMTVAKGLDRCLCLIEKILQQTDRKVRWICIGQGPLIGEIIAQGAALMKRYHNFIFSHMGSCTYPQIQYLHRISDVYMMLQRISIFDLATLEAMSKGKAVVLSAVGGNIEFNVSNNIIMFDGDYTDTAKQILNTDLQLLGEKNIQIYDRNFSNEVFIDAYHNAIDQLVGLESYSYFMRETDTSHHYIEKQVKKLNLKVEELNKSLNKTLDLTKQLEDQLKFKEAENGKIKYEPAYRDLYKRWCKGDTLKESEICKLIYNDVAWEKEDSLIWLVIACSLYERGDIYNLKYTLNKYYEKNGEKELYKYMPLCEFVVKSRLWNVENDMIKMSAELFGRFNNNLKKNVFLKKLKNKSIAVVGNGPSEVGKKLGREIDRHDIVIRFNNYSTEGYEEDYGKKTDIWVRGSGASDVIDRENISQFQLVIFEGDYWHLPIIPKNHPRTIYQYLFQNTAIMYFDKQIHTTLREFGGIEFPTSGLVTVWAIYQIRKQIKGLDIYGFSFRQEQQDGIATHYFKDRSNAVAIERSKVHALDKESEIIIKLLEGFNNEK